MYDRIFEEFLMRWSIAYYLHIYLHICHFFGNAKEELPMSGYIFADSQLKYMNTRNWNPEDRY